MPRGWRASSWSSEKESPTRRIALLLEYDGTEFAGSQFQPGRRTVQGTLEEAVERFTGERGRAAFAGRTDAGVHARGQVAAVSTETAHDAETFRRALNHFLSEDVVVRRAVEVTPGFDPRRHAVGRVYRYTVRHGDEWSPLARRQTWQVPHRLDVHAMASAAALLPREPRDWAAFAGPVPEGYPTVRTLRRCEVQPCGDRSLAVTVEADGFLPHQVRRTVGALERVGAGRLEVETFAALVEGPPGSAGPTAPPQGLTLVTVQYARGTVTWDDDEDVSPER